MNELSQELWKQIMSEDAFHAAQFALAKGNKAKAIECLKYALELCPDNKNASEALEQISG